MKKMVSITVFGMFALMCVSDAFAQAAYTIDFKHDGNDVIAEVRGQVDVSTLTEKETRLDARQTEFTYDQVAYGDILVLATKANPTQTWIQYTGFVTVPTESFLQPNGPHFLAKSHVEGAGDSAIGLDTGGTFEATAYLPEDYETSSEEFDIRWKDKTVTGLGLKPGVYVWEAPPVSEPGDNRIVLTIEEPPAAISAPTVNGFSPTFQVAGTTITIDGTGFNQAQSVTAVDFVGTDSFDVVSAASFNVVSDTELEAVVPSGLSGAEPHYIRVSIGTLADMSRNSFILKASESESSSESSTPAVPVPLSSPASLMLLILALALFGLRSGRLARSSLQ